jgi:hypothetical protein
MAVLPAASYILKASIGLHSCEEVLFPPTTRSRDPDSQFLTVPHAIFSFGSPVTWSSVAMTYGIQKFLLIHRFHFLSVFVSFTAD